MNVRIQVVAALAASILVVGCERSTTTASTPAASPAPAAAPAAPVSEPVAPQAAALAGFSHDASLDVFGYYMPEGEVKFGKWQMSSMNVGTPDELVKYERGERDPPNYAPVNIEFDDVTSPQKENELGGMYHTNSRRVLPVAYAISADRISFVGKDAELGDVRFEGQLDSAAVRRAAAGGTLTSGETIVLTGKLTVGAETRDVKFTWFGGD